MNQEKCPDCNIPLEARMHEVEGTHDLVEILTCVECGFKSDTVINNT